MRKEKVNKKIYKRWWFWLIALIIIGSIGSLNKEDIDTSKDNVNQQEVSDVSNSNGTDTLEPNKEETIFDFSNADLTNENITKAISKIIDEDKLKSIEITTEANKNIIDILYNPGTVWDEKSLVKNNAIIATDVMEILFKNQQVDKIWVWTETEMQDEKGNNSTEEVVNVCLTRENANDIEWTNFKNKVVSDYNALYDIADSSFIHPAIENELN